MVPDEQQIIRVKLYSYGFETANILAQKFYQLYQLAQQQLSQQKHYDWGLRNILSVLRKCNQQLKESWIKQINESEQDILIRVLIETNKPKLIDQDIDLFMDLIKDLFFNNNIQYIQDKSFNQLIKQSCQELQLCWEDPSQLFDNTNYNKQENNWFQSIKQLYDIQLIRHGIIILGPPQSGKTQIIYVLSKVLNKISNNKIKYHVIKINPKSVTNEQLFGVLHQKTNDWTDGIFSNIFKRCCQIGIKQKQENQQYQNFYFITFDGPIDPIYIENMNSLLDDSKILTLANQDRIQMTENIKLIFEVDNLKNASQAIISRNGMLCVEQFKQQNWIMLYYSWIQQWPKKFIEIMNNLLVKSNLVNNLYEYLDDQNKNQFIIPQLSYIKNFLQILISLILDGSDIQSQIYKSHNNDILDEVLQQTQLQVEQNQNNYYQALQQNLANCCKNILQQQFDVNIFKKLILFSLINSFNQTLDDKYTQEFNNIIIQWAKDYQIEIPGYYQQDNNINNYFVDQYGQWKNFNTLIEKYQFPEDYQNNFNQILIPTTQIIRIRYLLTKLSDIKLNILLSGESGCCKTQIIDNWLIKRYYIKNNVIENKITMSYSSTPQSIYENILTFLEKKQGNIYGPISQQFQTIFIDNLNKPKLNQWGDQCTSEFIRQLFEERGFYNLSKPGEFIQLQDINFILTTTLQKKKDIPDRLKSQFIILKIQQLNNEQIEQIYKEIINYHFISNQFKDIICNFALLLIQPTIQIWNKVKTTFLPTLQKIHYNFTIKDLSKIIQGLITSKPYSIQDEKQLIHLWLNEIFRTLSDKLINQQDIQKFINIIQSIIQQQQNEIIKNESLKYLNLIQNQLIDKQIDNNQYSYFIDFENCTQQNQEIQNTQRIYEEVTGKNNIIQKLNYYQQLYNQDPINKNNQNLNLIFFDSCIEHIIRINRILRIPRYHALLIGSSGNGKTNCAKLSSYIQGYKIYELELNKNYDLQQFDDYIKKIYKYSGLQQNGVSLIIKNIEEKDDEFLERISNLITNGTIQNLYSKDQQDEICILIRNLYKQSNPGRIESQQSLWNFFINNAINNLHILLVFQPNKQFLNKIEKFNEILNNTIIDYFHPLNQEAMIQITNNQFKLKQIGNIDEQQLQKLPNIFSYIYQFINNYTQEYYNKYDSIIYTTTKQYVQFIQLFINLYNQKIESLQINKNKLQTGLSTLFQASQDIEKMKIKLQQEQQILIKSQNEVNQKMEQLSIQKQEAENIAKQVKEVVKQCEEKTKIIAQNTEKALELQKKAEPQKIAAEKELNKITANDISNLLALHKPKSVIQRIFDMVMIFLYENVDEVNWDKDNTNIDNSIVSSWETCTKQVINKPGFLSRLQNFNKNGVTDEQCELIQAYIVRQLDMMDDIAASKAFKQVVGLNGWARCMVEYHKVMIDYTPIENQVIQLTQELQIATQERDKAQKYLEQKQKELTILQEDYERIEKQRQQIQEQVKNTQQKLLTAENLINGLQNEKIRWEQEIKQIDLTLQQLIGIIIISATFLTYCGPFNQEYRQKIFETLTQKFDEFQINYDHNINKQLINILSSEQDLCQFSSYILNDTQFLQNILIMKYSQKYPLLIDPQQQGQQFLQNTYKNTIIIKQSDNQIKDILENALQNGKIVIIEDVDEQINYILDNIIKRNIYSSNTSINFNNKIIKFNEKFQLFLVTKIQKLRFNPDIYSNTSVIDFTVTFQSLQEQLLTKTIQIEKYELEQQKQNLFIQIQENKLKLINLENNLLNKLSQSQINILDDEYLQKVLEETKQTTDNVKQQLEINNKTNMSIDQQRNNYIQVSIRGTNIYFAAMDFSRLNHMYQISLEQFLYLFDKSLRSIDYNQFENRINMIIKNITKQLLNYLYRGYYEKDKLLFSLNLAIKIDQFDGGISNQEFTMFIKSEQQINKENYIQKPQQLQFLSEQSWNNIQLLSQIEYFKNIIQMMQNNSTQWEKYYNSNKIEIQNIPQYIELNQPQKYKNYRFKKLLLIKYLRYDRSIQAINQYIQQVLDQDSTIYQVEDLSDILLYEANSITPIIFLLSQGNDPYNQIQQIAKRYKIQFNTISMGQNQEQKVTNMIINAQINGQWIIINNCHLACDYMIYLYELLSQSKNNQNNVHQQFRLILTTEQNQQFPIQLLQNSIKLANDSLSGMRLGLLKTYESLSQDILDSVDQSNQWLPILYSLVYLNQSIIERKKYQSLGWCQQYEFGDYDFNVIIKYLQQYFYGLNDTNKQIQFNQLQYMISEVYYGGRITDDFDLRLMKVYTEEYINSQIFNSNFSYGKFNQEIKMLNPYFDPTQRNQDKTSIDFIINYINQLPSTDSPQMYHLNQNAEILYMNQQTQIILRQLQQIQPQQIQQQTILQNQIIQDICIKILQQLPEDYQLKGQVKNKLDYLKQFQENKPLIILLEQEINQIQNVLNQVKKDINQIKFVTNNLIVMSQDIYDIINSIYNSKTPQKWIEMSFQYENLDLWIDHLRQSCQQYNKWLNSDKGYLQAYWINGLFNPKGFLTSVKQIISRKNNISIDQIKLKYTIGKKYISSLQDLDSINQTKQQFMIYGIYLQSGFWNFTKDLLTEQQSKQLYQLLPAIIIEQQDQIQQKQKTKIYQCPLYMTPKRSQQTYITTIDIPCEKTQNYWILQGTALLCQKD